MSLHTTPQEVAEIMAAERASYIVPLDCFGRPLPATPKAPAPVVHVEPETVDPESVPDAEQSETKLQPKTEKPVKKQPMENWTAKSRSDWQRGYWASMTPEQRSAESKRRRAVAKAKLMRQAAPAPALEAPAKLAAQVVPTPSVRGELLALRDRLMVERDHIQTKLDAVSQVIDLLPV